MSLPVSDEAGQMDPIGALWFNDGFGVDSSVSIATPGTAGIGRFR
jgi:hypothetical protein